MFSRYILSLIFVVFSTMVFAFQSPMDRQLAIEKGRIFLSETITQLSKASKDAEIDEVLKRGMAFSVSDLGNQKVLLQSLKVIVEEKIQLYEKKKDNKINYEALKSLGINSLIAVATGYVTYVVSHKWKINSKSRENNDTEQNRIVADLKAMGITITEREDYGRPGTAARFTRSLYQDFHSSRPLTPDEERNAKYYHQRYVTLKNDAIELNKHAFGWGAIIFGGICTVSTVNALYSLTQMFFSSDDQKQYAHWCKIRDKINSFLNDTEQKSKIVG